MFEWDHRSKLQSLASGQMNTVYVCSVPSRMKLEQPLAILSHRSVRIRRESIGYMDDLIQGRTSTCMMDTMMKQSRPGLVVISLHRISKKQRHSPERHRQQTHSHGKQRCRAHRFPRGTPDWALQLSDRTDRVNPHAGKHAHHEDWFILEEEPCVASPLVHDPISHTQYLPSITRTRYTRGPTAAMDYSSIS